MLGNRQGINNSLRKKDCYETTEEMKDPDRVVAEGV
jgi:hypothetical protein